MTRTELIIQLLKVAIGLAFGAYFVWWSLQVLDSFCRRGCSGKLLSPARRRACIGQVRAQVHVSERRACAALGQHHSTQRNLPHGRDDEQRPTADIVALARQYGRTSSRPENGPNC